MVSKPKPTKADRKRVKVKATTDQPRKEPMGKRKKRVEKQLEAMVKMLIAWRDGQECVMKGRGPCGNGMMWNHLVAQSKSPWLRYDLGNVFWGCGTHNMEDHFGSTVMPSWFISVFGVASFQAMDYAREFHIGMKYSLTELETMLEHYDNLYQNRYTVNADTDSLVAAGYFGNIIKNTYTPKG